MDIGGYRLFIYDDIDKKIKPSIRDYYWKQINNDKNWKPISDDIYNQLDENGWLDDLLFMDKDIDKNNFEIKKLKIKEEHKIGLEYYDEETVQYFNNFDTEIKNLQKYPFKLLMYINYNKGNVFFIKYK